MIDRLAPPSLLAPLLAGLLPACTVAQDSRAVLQPSKELGIVTWLRDFDRALANNPKTKPVFALFQEVPG